METGNFQLEMEEFDTSTDEILSQMEMPDIKDYEAQQEMKDFKSIYVPRRFSLPTTEQELQTAASKSYSDNTKRKSQWVMRVYQAWVTQWNAHNEHGKIGRDVLKMDKAELIDTLCKFVTEARNSKGEAYP